ncbi:MAG: hypothetical protein GX062_04305 [Firmicutes bacterium]|jgi:hypothetical protein|nr:hypothetical protein [Bacillota bacterium]
MRCSIKVVTSFCLAALLVSLSPASCLAATSTIRQSKILIVAVDSLSLADVLGEDLPYLKSFFATGAWGLINTNQGGTPSLESAYLTLGSGTRAKGSGKSIALSLTTELAEEAGAATEVHARRTGYRLSQDQGIVQLGLAALKTANESLNYEVQVGALGQALRSAGLETAVIGVADTLHPERHIINLLMDEQGYVPYGNVGQELLSRDPTGPYGFWTDTATIIQETRKVWDIATVIAVEWPDLYRAEQYAAFSLPSTGRGLRQAALLRLNSFLSEFLPTFTAPDVTILLLSPTPGKDNYASGHRLTPIAWRGPGVTHGLIVSPTTRRHGLAANIDIAPTILAQIGLTWGPAVLGRPLSTRYDPEPLQKLALLEKRAVASFNLRPMIIRLYIGYLILVLALTVGALLGRNERLAQLISWLLPAGAAVPLVFLILAALPVQPLAPTVALTVLATILIVVCLRRLTGSPIRTLIATAIITVLLLAWDIAKGQNLIASSILGYCFISGARYYGIGNEYMGVFLGAALPSLGYLLDHYQLEQQRVYLTLVLFLLLGTVFLGGNSYGANAGGILAFVSATALVALGLRYPEPRIREIVIGLTLAIVFVSLLAWSDWHLATQTSHIGQAVKLVTQSGFGSARDIVIRKLGMNLKLLRYSLWSRVLLMLLITLCSLFYGPYRWKLKFAKERRLLVLFLRGTVAGIVVALIANDSGVVAAATALLYPVSLLILLVLPKGPREKQQNQQELATERN